MKRFLCSAVLVTCFGGTAYGQSCVWPDEKSAFEVIGLKNALMVAALSCQADDSYNRFVGKFQAALQDSQGVMDRYFVRRGGLAGRQQEDAYMTQLANAQSAGSLAQGATYCAGAEDEFREVLGLPDAETLMAFAAGDGDAQVAAMAVCDGAPPVGIGGGTPPDGVGGGAPPDGVGGGAPPDGFGGGAPPVIAAAGPRRDGGGVVVAAGKTAIGVKTASAAHVRRKAVVKAPAKPAAGLVQV